MDTSEDTEPMDTSEDTEPEDTSDDTEPEDTTAGGGSAPAGGGDTEQASPSCTGEADGTLSIATVLPETGSLAFLGPPEFAGANLAVEDINAAGGVLGEDVILDEGDSGDTSTDIANQTVDRQLAAGADVFIGAASSGVSFTFIDKLVENCKIHFSPANTSPDFTDYADDDLYFRTAPSDVLQGRVLADLMIEDGITNATFIALQDPYGEGLLEFSSGPFEEQGGEIVDSFTYDPNADNFGPEVERIVSGDPDALVLIGFEESAQILTTLFESGFTADQKAIYLVDGNVGNALGEQLPPGSLVGVKGTLPQAELQEDFRTRLLEVDPALIDFSYAAETYDAIIITALAAELAESDDPALIAAQINGVTRDGTACTTFEECKALIEEGEDIDYDGPAGPMTFGPQGEPTEASFAILSYDEANLAVGGEVETEYRFAQI
ncbi:MAG: ABC transporter substrate-binding protein [Ilumatobacteraceae bacterium]